MKNIHITRR